MDQLLLQEKMASVGQLAAGVAHEINNPTGFISSNLNSLNKFTDKMIEFIDVVSEGKTSDEIMELRSKLHIDTICTEVKNLIAESLEGTDRIKSIATNLKSFSRNENGPQQNVDINECLERTLTIIHNELKYKANVKKAFEDLPLITCYPQQLSQVFMNLLVNGAHAIEKFGEIIIRTRHEDGRILVSISDNGHGIGKETMGRLFEPFFTTKKDGEGTGLGLSICYDIVNKHNGQILVESEVGKGSTFQVAIPTT